MQSKFRAWDERNNEMVYSDKEESFYVNTKGVYFMYAIPKTNPVEYYKTYDVQQYIGIDDDTKREIYSGDIVMCISGLATISTATIGVVKMVNYCWGIEKRNKSFFSFNDAINENSSFKVIGELPIGAISKRIFDKKVEAAIQVMFDNELRPEMRNELLNEITMLP